MKKFKLNADSTTNFKNVKRLKSQFQIIVEKVLLSFSAG